jgi:predicted alpha/beta hydrolase
VFNFGFDVHALRAPDEFRRSRKTAPQRPYRVAGEIAPVLLDHAPASGTDLQTSGSRNDAPVETHWTRILHHDLFAANHVGPGADEGTDRRDPLPRAWARWPGSRAKGTRRRGAERTVLTAADGYPITGVRYAGSGPTRGHVIVAGAIGVSQRFYRRFAEFAAALGYATMTLDYRGVGLSAPATLEGFRMDYFDWARLDLAAAVAAMSSPGVPLYVVGHSFGGHAFGMLPNHARVARFYTFGTGAGWHGWMPLIERIKVLALWHVVAPLLTRWKGYLSLSLLGMGEDLPLDFYTRWRRWCRYPNYFFGDPSVRYLLRSFDRVRAPLMAANSIDDRWAPPQSRDAFIAGYRNAARQTLDIDPARFGLREIGHMGYFRASAASLWESALGWLETGRSGAPGMSSSARRASTLESRQPLREPFAGAHCVDTELDEAFHHVRIP